MKKIVLLIIISAIIACCTNKVAISEVQSSGDLLIYKGEPYSGLLFQNHRNGKPKFQCTILEGSKNGDYIEYYENGTIKCEGTFKNNLFYPKIIKIGSGLKDINGINYSSTIIGNQEWMSENLKTTHFSTGDTIFYAKTAKDWAIAYLEKRPAFCYVQDNESDPNNYGLLYNHYAIMDSRGLAPKGWKIPNKNEWQLLRDYTFNNGIDLTDKYAWTLFSNNFNAVILKSTQNWFFGGANLNGNNYSGFNATPTGNVKFGYWQNIAEKSYIREFNGQNHTAQWWINSKKPSCAYIFDNEDLDVSKEGDDGFGFAVRFLKIDKK
jgi:uncharacterized protein (TIGR02145 family)